MAGKAIRYIIMPKQGLRHPDLKNADFALTGKSRKLQARRSVAAAPSVKVIDSLAPDGPKLLEMPAEGELSLRLSHPDLKLVREVFYEKQWKRYRISKPVAAAASRARGRTKSAKMAVAAPAAALAAAAATIKVSDGVTGAPLAGARVVAFVDFAAKSGAEATSDANGVVALANLTSTMSLERVYVYAPPGYWDFYAADTNLRALAKVALRPLDLRDPTLLLPAIYGTLALDAGSGVTVGVVDSGVDGAHPALANVTGGLNCVGAEVSADPSAAAQWGPAAVEGEHGTHVAGIIGGNGAGNGFRGVAPGVKIRSYRVFPNVGGGASNFDIAKAIDAASTDGCGVINMSLGGGASDDLTEAAIARALAGGAIVVAATGNENRQPVDFPAAFPECVAVSAMGRVGSFPADSIGASDVADPRGGQGGQDFLADFSNVGPQVDVVGPGVEIVSTLPGGAYGSMSGTSMATPAVSGFAAALAAADAGVRAANGGDRSQKLKTLLYSRAKPEGFGRDDEGFGLPQP